MENIMRKLWVQHVYWTRFFIISTAAELSDLDDVTKRLLQNPQDFAQVLTPFYGTKTANRFAELLTEHLMIAGDLVNAAKAGQTEKVDEIRRKWYTNADEIATFLSGINPFWSEQKWRVLLYDHLQMTEKEAALRLSGEFAQDILIFERIEEEAMKMADYMAYGICRQFGL